MAAGEWLGDAEGEGLEPTATTTGTVSRRGLLRRGLAFGVAAPVLLVALQACGDDDDDDDEGGDDAPSGEPSAAPSPSRAGTSPSPAGASSASPSPGGISVELPPTSAPQPSPPAIGG